MVARRFFLDQRRGANLTEQALLELQIDTFSLLQRHIDRIKDARDGSHVRTWDWLFGKLKTLLAEIREDANESAIKDALGSSSAKGASEDKKKKQREKEDRERKAAAKAKGAVANADAQAPGAPGVWNWSIIACQAFGERVAADVVVVTKTSSDDKEATVATVLVVRDEHTGFIRAFPLVRKSTENVVRCFLQFISKHARPRCHLQK
eukprot:s5654_g6.t1